MCGYQKTDNRQTVRLATHAENANTFEAVAKEWIEKTKAGSSAYYRQQIERVFKADVYPAIGKVLNLLHRLLDGKQTDQPDVNPPAALTLSKQPEANVARYDGLRNRSGQAQAGRHNRAVTMALWLRLNFPNVTHPQHLYFCPAASNRGSRARLLAAIVRMKRDRTRSTPFHSDRARGLPVCLAHP